MNKVEIINGNFDKQRAKLNGAEVNLIKLMCCK